MPVGSPSPLPSRGLIPRILGPLRVRRGALPHETAGGTGQRNRLRFANGAKPGIVLLGHHGLLTTIG